MSKVSLSKSLGGLRARMAGEVAEPEAEPVGPKPVAQKSGSPKVQTARLLEVQTAKRPNVRVTGKKQHPDYTQVTVYIRKDTHKLARRRCEDAGGEDFSDLVERLVAAYLER